MCAARPTRPGSAAPSLDPSARQIGRLAPPGAELDDRSRPVQPLASSKSAHASSSASQPGTLRDELESLRSIHLRPDAYAEGLVRVKKRAGPCPGLERSDSRKRISRTASCSSNPAEGSAGSRPIDLARSAAAAGAGCCGARTARPPSAGRCPGARGRSRACGRARCRAVRSSSRSRADRELERVGVALLRDRPEVALRAEPRVAPDAAARARTSARRAGHPRLPEREPVVAARAGRVRVAGDGRVRRERPASRLLEQRRSSARCGRARAP